MVKSSYRGSQREKETVSRYYGKHKEQVDAYQKKYRLEHREKRRIQERNRRLAKPEMIKLSKKQETRQLKIEVLTHYGKGSLACVTCGESRLSCLSIDHINGGGTKHRRSLGRAGRDFYRWLRSQDYPLGYQTLCMNCQFIKRFGDE